MNEDKIPLESPKRFVDLLNNEGDQHSSPT